MLLIYLKYGTSLVVQVKNLPSQGRGCRFDSLLGN